MKIINKDNFNRESMSDSVVAENVPDFYADTITEALNNKFGGERSTDYFLAVQDDYEIYIFDPT